MKDSRVGCAPASHGTLRRGEEGGAVVKRRLPDRSKDSWRETAMMMGWTQEGAMRRHPVRYWTISRSTSRVRARCTGRAPANTSRV